MNENWDIEELKAVAAALAAFEARCEEIMMLLGEKRYLPQDERERVQDMYRSLKTDLKEAAKYGTLSGMREPLSRAESAFYDGAIRKAHIALRPATNSNPITSRWFGAVHEAQMEFSYYRHNLASLLSE